MCCRACWKLAKSKWGGQRLLSTPPVSINPITRSQRNRIPGGNYSFFSSGLSSVGFFSSVAAGSFFSSVAAGFSSVAAGFSSVAAGSFFSSVAAGVVTAGAVGAGVWAPDAGGVVGLAGVAGAPPQPIAAKHRAKHANFFISEPSSSKRLPRNWAEHLPRADWTHSPICLFPAKSKSAFGIQHILSRSVRATQLLATNSAAVSRGDGRKEAGWPISPVMRLWRWFQNDWNQICVRAVDIRAADTTIVLSRVTVIGRPASSSLTIWLDGSENQLCCIDAVAGRT